MDCKQLFPALGTLVCLGATVRAPWAQSLATPRTVPLAAASDGTAAAFIGLPDIRAALGFGDAAPDSQVFGEFVELIDPNAIHHKLESAYVQGKKLARAGMSKQQVVDEQIRQHNERVAEMEAIAREVPPQKPVQNWLADEAGLMAQAIATLGLKPGASKAEIVKAIEARRNSRLGKALQTLSGSGLASIDAVRRGIEIDRFVTLGALRIPGWNLVALTASGTPDPSQLTGLERAKAAHARELAIGEARSRAAGRVTLSASVSTTSGLTGLQRAIASHRANP